MDRFVAFQFRSVQISRYVHHRNITDSAYSAESLGKFLNENKASAQVGDQLDDFISMGSFCHLDKSAMGGRHGPRSGRYIRLDCVDGGGRGTRLGHNVYPVVIAFRPPT